MRIVPPFRRSRASVSGCARVTYRWDLDKTYLQSDFDSLRELVKVPFEKARDKVAAPGVAALIRGLRETATRHGQEVHVQFLSASPPQIGRAIKEKLELDGIGYDSIIFKNQLQRLMRGKFRHLREHVGYKLTELLKARRDDPPEARECLFGDDWESDPLIYSLYADIVAGRLSTDDLTEILAAVGVEPQLIALAGRLSCEVPRAEAVVRVFINLDRRTPPANFRSFGARLVPTFNYFQTAACLFEEGMLDAAGVEAVARSLVRDSGYSPERLANSLGDVQRRGHLQPPVVRQLQTHLAGTHLLAPGRGVSRWRTWWDRLWTLRPGGPRLPALVPIDYRAVLAQGQPADSR